MAVDLRLFNCLPEHQGPAFRTWSQIIQTTAMSSGAATSPLLSPNSCASLESSFPSLSPAEEFIPFNDSNGKEKVNGEENCKLENGSFGKRKRLGHGQESIMEFEDVSTQTYAPWKRKIYPENAYGLHLEIKDFYEYMSPSLEEKFMRQDVVQRMKNLIQNIWPAARVEVFGSFKTNLYLPTSDIDLVVFGKWEKLPLWTLERALVTQDVSDASTIKVLDKASVPIVKLTDKRSNIKVDISFNMDTAVRGAELIQKFLKEYEVLPYIFLVLKHFLVMRDLNEVFTGGISSYCLMLLTVSFLQMHPRQESKLTNANIGVLLIEFFELYGRNFNYQRTGIKIRDGGSYCSKDEIMKEMSDGQFPSLLCIEDPVSKEIDIGKSSFGIMRVKEAFEYAYNVLDSALRNRSYFKINPNSTYLSRIIQVPVGLIEYRKWVTDQYKDEAAAAFLQFTNNDLINRTQPSSRSSEKSMQDDDNTDASLHTNGPTYSKDFHSSQDEASFNKNRHINSVETGRDLQPDIFDKHIMDDGPVPKCLHEAKTEQKLSKHKEPTYLESNSEPSNGNSLSSTENVVSHKTNSEDQKPHEKDDTKFENAKKLNNDQQVSAFFEVGTDICKFSIGAGGACQWSSDENPLRNSLDSTSKDKTKDEEHSKTRHVSHSDMNNRRARSPCEGISEHDLESARQARQLIISSPEKPLIKPIKWGKKEAKNSGKETRTAEQSRHNTPEDRSRETKSRQLRKDSFDGRHEDNNAKHHSKQKNEISHNNDDNFYSHKHGAGQKRRSKREQKP